MSIIIRIINYLVSILIAVFTLLKIIDMSIGICYGFFNVNIIKGISGKIHPPFWITHKLTKKIKKTAILYKFPILITLSIVFAYVSGNFWLGAIHCFLAALLTIFAIIHRLADILSLGKVDYYLYSVRLGRIYINEMNKNKNYRLRKNIKPEKILKKFLYLFIVLFIFHIANFININFFIIKWFSLEKHLNICIENIGNFFIKILYLLYYAITTALTVGFGDIYPTSPLSIFIVTMFEIGTFILVFILFATGISFISSVTSQKNS